MKRVFATLAWLWAFGFGAYVVHSVVTEVTKGRDFHLGFLSLWPSLTTVWTLPPIMFGVLALVSDWVEDEAAK